MARKQAKIFTKDTQHSLLADAATTRHPVRNTVIVIAQITSQAPRRRPRAIASSIYLWRSLWRQMIQVELSIGRSDRI